jgi:hypothetical protein
MCFRVSVLHFYSTTGYTALGLCPMKRRREAQIYSRHFVRFSEQNFVILRNTDLKWHKHEFRGVKYWKLRPSGLLCTEQWWFLTEVSRIQIDSWPLKMEHIGRPERSVTNCHYSLRNGTVECSSHFLRSGRLKSRYDVLFIIFVPNCNHIYGNVLLTF